MINKNIKKRFGRECPTALISDSMEQAKREVVWEVTKEIALNTDHIFRLDTYTTTDPVLDEIVFIATCKAEEVDEVSSIFNRRIVTPKQFYCPWPKDVIFNAPATIVLWRDGSKTVVKCMDGEEFNPEVGLAMCFCKAVMGDDYKRWFKESLKKGRWQND